MSRRRPGSARRIAASRAIAIKGDADRDAVKSRGGASNLVEALAHGAGGGIGPHIIRIERSTRLARRGYSPCSLWATCASVLRDSCRHLNIEMIRDFLRAQRLIQCHGRTIRWVGLHKDNIHVPL